MNKNLKIRLFTDSGMTLALLLLMSYQLVGEKAHEWIGMAMFLLVIGHHVLNRRWTGNITKGKYTAHRILQTVIVALLALTMIGSMVSGILLSNYIFRFVRIEGVANMARNIHILCAYWGFLLMAVCSYQNRFRRLPRKNWLLWQTRPMHSGQHLYFPVI